MQLSTPLHFSPSAVTRPVLSASKKTATETDALQKRFAAWMQAIAAGDQAAFTQFYDATNRQTYGLLLRMLKNPATAEEVLLDVYLQVWRQAAHYETARGSVLAWLMTIARTRALDRMRASGYQARENEDLEIVSLTKASADDSPEETSLLNERQRMVRAALAQLSPEQRSLIEAAYFDGLSHSELAERFDLPLGTVKTRIRSGMLVLRKELGQLAN
jgi:RNA polymerase sigma-70 factor (ECF subfamily)